jgi:hypothetical protein
MFDGADHENVPAHDGNVPPRRPEREVESEPEVLAAFAAHMGEVTEGYSQ